jgi:hypothetical protein
MTEIYLFTIWMATGNLKLTIPCLKLVIANRNIAYWDNPASPINVPQEYYDDIFKSQYHIWTSTRVTGHKKRGRIVVEWL